MRKYIKQLTILVVCIFAVAIAVYARDDRVVNNWRSYMYTSEELVLRSQGLEIRGTKPVITADYAHYTRVNDAIEVALEGLLDTSRRMRARSVVVSYEVYSTHGLVSIVISANSRAVTDRVSVTSVNFNPATGAFVTLTGAIGRDITPLIRGIISDMIRRDPATYYAAFNAPPAGQAFYLTATCVVILFDEFQLSSTPGATTQIQMTRANIRYFTISPNEYHLGTGRYSVKMMPLRTILEGLGYSEDDFAWCGTTLTATIFRNGRSIVSLSVGVNNYHRIGVMQRSLETAPVQINSSVYVPITFFDQILSLTSYSIDAMGNITFITYLD